MDGTINLLEKLYISPNLKPRTINNRIKKHHELHDSNKIKLIVVSPLNAMDYSF